MTNEKDRIPQLEDTIEGLLQRLWILVQRQGGKVSIKDIEFMDIPKTALTSETYDITTMSTIIKTSK